MIAVAASTEICRLATVDCGSTLMAGLYPNIRGRSRFQEEHPRGNPLEIVDITEVLDLVCGLSYDIGYEINGCALLIFYTYTIDKGKAVVRQ